MTPLIKSTDGPERTRVGLVTLAKESFANWQSDKAPRLAAALAYYTAFSLAPLLLIVIGIAGLVFGREAAQGQILNGPMQGILGAHGAEQLRAFISGASKPSSGIFATIIGVIMLVLGASGVFGQLKDALNTIWHVEPQKKTGVLGLIKDRFLSFSMVIGIAFLLLVSLVVNAVLTALSTWIANFLPGLAILMTAVGLIISLVIVTCLFAMTFKILPDAKIAWKDVWIGAAVTGLFFVIGQLVIGLYLGKGGVASSYGPAAGLVVMLVWVYYSAQILLFGAEFTKAYAKHRGAELPAGADQAA